MFSLFRLWSAGHLRNSQVLLFHPFRTWGSLSVFLLHPLLQVLSLTNSPLCLSYPLQELHPLLFSPVRQVPAQEDLQRPSDRCSLPFQQTPPAGWTDTEPLRPVYPSPVLSLFLSPYSSAQAARHRLPCPVHPVLFQRRPTSSYRLQAFLSDPFQFCSYPGPHPPSYPVLSSRRPYFGSLSDRRFRLPPFLCFRAHPFRVPPQVPPVSP